MPVEDGRARQRRADYEHRECKPPTGEWLEGCNVA
jgi:hypothetical protein